MDVSPRAQTRVSLAEQIKHFGKLYQSHSNLYKNEEWHEFCIGLIELWDLVWVPTPSETPADITGRQPEGDRLREFRQEMLPSRQAFLKRVRVLPIPIPHIRAPPTPPYSCR
jgi:hypothetical protein